VTFTYIPGTPIGLVRQLCTDRDPDHEIFSDEEIEALLDLNNGNVRYAAADALDQNRCITGPDPQVYRGQRPENKRAGSRQRAASARPRASGPGQRPRRPRMMSISTSSPGPGSIHRTRLVGDDLMRSIVDPPAHGGAGEPFPRPLHHPVSHGDRGRRRAGGQDLDGPAHRCTHATSCRSRAGEIKRPNQTYVVANTSIALQGHYADIVESDRAIVGGTTYDILLAESPLGTMTRLSCEVVR